MVVRHRFIQLRVPQSRFRQVAGSRLASSAKRGYRIVAVSLYDDDIAALDWLVAWLRRRGADASRSAAVRWALSKALIVARENKRPYIAHH